MAVGIPRREGEIFVSELYDSTNDERFYRPIGGEVEFTEYSPMTLVREYNEELGISIEVGEFLGSIENLFEVDGTVGHEIVFVYDLNQTDELWNATEIKGEDDGGTTFIAEWKPREVFECGEEQLYPDGLLRLFTEDTKHVIPQS
ncbi:NUDIX hydrolase [halophilic archaeon]|nr:NUDIX hydrolase [halophilic archaeon]